MGPITNVANSWIEAFKKELGFSLNIFCPVAWFEKYKEKIINILEMHINGSKSFHKLLVMLISAEVSCRLFINNDFWVKLAFFKW